MKAFKRQIDDIATVDKVEEITRSVKKLKNLNLLVAVAAVWVAFDDTFDGEKAAIIAFLVWAGNVGGQSGLDKMVPDTAFNLTNIEIINKLEARADFLATVVDTTTQKWVAQTIESGLKQGMSDADIVKYLREEVVAEAEERADIIAETELAYAINLVEQEAFKRNGIEKKRWVTAEDERVEELCIANETAGVINIDQMYPSGVMTPPQHQRCRCFSVPVLPTSIEGVVWNGQ